MRKLILILTFLIPILVWALPKEQDRAIFEGNNRNILDNPGFEARKGDWSITGSSTFTLETAAPAAGKISGKWDPSATGEFFRSVLIPIPEGLKNRACSLVFDYKWAGVAGEILANVDNGSTNEGSVGLDPSATEYRQSPPILFTCPGSGSIRVELESTADAAEITLDSFQLGKANLVKFAEASFFGSVTYPGVINCIWGTTSATFASFALDADCTTPSGGNIIGRVAAPATKIPAVLIPEMPPGRYYFIAHSRFAKDSGNNGEVSFRFHDGTNPANEVLRVLATGTSSGTDIGNSSLAGTFVVTATQTNVTVEVQGLSPGGVVTANVDAQANSAFTINVFRYPLAAEDGLTFETVGEHWDVNIGGDDPDMGVGAVTAYAGIDCTTCDMVINAGSKSAEIPCTSTNASVGLTCTGGTTTESVGIVIDVSTAGRYEICGEFSHSYSLAASAGINVAFQWVETPNNAQTILQLGNNRAPSGTNVGASNNIDMNQQVKSCAEFTFSGSGQKTLRLFREQNTTGTVNSNVIAADRLVTLGQRDIHITVNKLDQQFPTPVFTDLTTSLNLKVENNANGMRLFSIQAANSGTPTITVEKGSWVDSLTDNAVGDTTINITSGIFTTLPTCVCSVDINAFGDICTIVPSNSTTVRVRTAVDTGGATDSAFQTFCFGE